MSLPTGFHWVLDGLLAGSGKPGLLTPLEDDMSGLRARGIEVIVTLTEEPLAPPPTEWGFAAIHFPIRDMGFPTPRDCDQRCVEIVSLIEARRPVLLHCKAGLGRTGTVLACCLVALGRTAEAAIEEVRAVSRWYIQTAGQLAFIGHYAEYRQVTPR